MQKAPTNIKLLEEQNDEIFDRFPTTNPYTVGNNHEVAKLRLTQRGFSQWIDYQNRLKYLLYLDSTFEPITISRTYLTTIKPGSRDTICGSLAKCLAFIIHY